MRQLLMLFALFFFMSCTESPVEPEPTPTELITQNGYWTNQTSLDPPFFGIDEIVTYLHFDKDGNGEMDYSFFTEGKETQKNLELFMWSLIEENETLYIHFVYSDEDFSQPQDYEIFSLSKTSMGLSEMNDEPLMFEFISEK